jgi:hypothetical protein
MPTPTVLQLRTPLMPLSSQHLPQQPKLTLILILTPNPKIALGKILHLNKRTQHPSLGNNGLIL